MSEYHHGVRIVEINDGTRPIRTVATASGKAGTLAQALKSIIQIIAPGQTNGKNSPYIALDNQLSRHDRFQ